MANLRFILAVLSILFTDVNATWNEGCEFPEDWDGRWVDTSSYGVTFNRNSSTLYGWNIYGTKLAVWGEWQCVAEETSENLFVFRSIETGWTYDESWYPDNNVDVYRCIRWSKEREHIYKYFIDTDETEISKGSHTHAVPVNTTKTFEDLKQICYTYYTSSAEDEDFILLFEESYDVEPIICPTPMLGIFNTTSVAEMWYDFYAFDFCSSMSDVEASRYYPYSYGVSTYYNDFYCIYSHYEEDATYAVLLKNRSSSYYFSTSHYMCLMMNSSGYIGYCDQSNYHYYYNLHHQDVKKIEDCQCPSGKWGRECQSNTNCDSTGTYAVDYNDGTCHCKAGWTGSLCADDIDECSSTSHVCSVHADCMNTQGSYQCTCQAGYTQTATGSCGGMCVFPDDLDGDWMDTHSQNKVTFEKDTSSITYGWNITAFGAEHTQWTCHQFDESKGLYMFESNKVANHDGTLSHLIRCMNLTKVGVHRYKYNVVTGKNSYGDRVHSAPYTGAPASLDINNVCDGSDVDEINDVHFILKIGHIEDSFIICPNILLGSMTGMTDKCSDSFTKASYSYWYYMQSNHTNGTTLTTCTELDTLLVSNPLCSIGGNLNYNFLYNSYWYPEDYWKRHYRCVYYEEEDNVTYTYTIRSGNVTDFQPFCFVSKKDDTHVLMHITRGSCDKSKVVWSEAFNLTVHICPENRWGRDCNKNCSCVQSHTEECSRSDGSCKCKPGYSGTNCTSDIDECLTPNICGTGSCLNTVGSYLCQCPQYFVTSDTGTCVCEPWRFGSNCTGECSCDRDNTETCDVATGSCTCKPGYEGDDCNTDINECLQAQICGNGVCVNTAGSYHCDCQDGYFKNADEICFDGFPFGTWAGDSVLQGDDTVQNISVGSNIPFGVLPYRIKYLLLGVNGFIGLEREFSYWPWLRWTDENSKIIAPFWTDLDTAENGRVFYQTWEMKGKNMKKNTDLEKAVLNSASQKVRTAMNKNSFTARWVFVSTWHNVVLYGRNEPLTFQAAIISNIRHQTYVIFNYINLDLPSYWNYGYWWYYWRYVDIGYRTGPFKLDYTRNSYSGWRDTAFQMSTIQGNFENKTGQWFFALARLSLKKSVEDDEMNCYLWYQDEKYDDEVENFRNLVLDPELVCPCTEDRIAQADFKWQHLRNINLSWGYNLTCYAANNLTVNYSMECCYRHNRWVRWWWWREGHSRFLRNNPFRNDTKANYIEYDETPRNQCCSTGHCDWYREVRPRGFCYTTSPYVISWTFGDPHIKTLDGKDYTFNGLGEYIMMNASTSNSTFKLQARTERAETEDGQQTNATVFTAFAASDASGATIQVELSNDKNSLVVVGNGDDITADFNADTSYSKSESNLVITRILNNTCQAYFTGSGVGVKVSLGIRLLTVVVAAPNYLQGNTKGLLGNYDSDPNNDFVLPNGTILHTNSSQREIFNNFGQKWLIDPSDSLFTYPTGKSAGDYVDTAFEPLFVDEVDPQTLANATAQCGGASVASQACIFDFLATNDTALAQESGQTDTQGNAQIASLSNASPDLTGNETIYVRVNETVQLSYNASDDGTYSYVFLQTPSSNFHIDTSSGQALITWTPTDTNAVNISVTAQDDHNVFAPTIDTTIVLCGRCSERGTCNNNVTIETDTPNFYLASCDCDTGYSGSECESDFNGCANSPCDQGRTCIDLPPIEHALLDRAYNCSDCPTGFYENNTKCVDVDECSDPTTCSQVCTNLEGTYVCDCFSGYRKLNNSCVDVDECADQTHSCEQFCVNEPGNYSCSCAFGYDLNSDKKTCTLVTDMCAVNGLTCEHGCDNSTGTFQCFCRRGYQLDSNGQSCVDVDECQLNICTQNCTNTDGGYSCSCFSGYKLADDGVSCTECLPPNYGMECASTCSCGLGMDYCDPVKGCVCLDTFTGTSCSQDVDECAENPAICASTTKYCENEIGDYQCFCYDGFEHVGDACVDVDECSSIVTNVCPIGKSTCENNQGNYTCVCNQGYIQNGPYACTDIDECSQNSHGCEQGCTNVPESYNCICEAGFQINNDRKTCTKVSDPCPAYSSLTCSYGCRMNGNNPECFCQSGYTLTTDSQTCIDVNECSDNSLNLCGVPENCVNTPGGHNCSCNAGFKLENDGRTCTACDQFHYGTNCAQTCNCGVGADHCDSVSGCVCRSGWLGDKCDTDIDECSSSVCTDPNAQCINSPGTYHCLCKDGYTNTARRRRSTTSSQCLDIDECAQTNNCTQVCTNTPGSYVCSCHSGFQLINGTICSDIDECALPSVCDHDCINSEGGYTCSCRDGYNLNATDRMSCHPKTECVSTTCEQSCYVDNTGNEHCMCNSGYTLNSDGTSCDNIDECTLNNPCSSGDCLDLTPGFICNCPSGQKLSADKITCLDCDDGTYGVNCASNCTCAEATSTSCDKVAGTCTCAVGYQGLDCSTDIDECTTGSATCPSNSYCVNTPGSYRCQCEDGFVMANGNCSACSSTKYGTNCAQTCACDTSYSTDCNNINGSCTCITGWEGTTCQTDVDECQISGLCGNGQCINNAGSYSCSCNSGYEGSNCTTDVDECTTNPSICGSHGTCVNSVGSYSCSCDNGWSGTHCTDGDCAIDRTICGQNMACESSSCVCWEGYTRASSGLCTERDSSKTITTLVFILDITLFGIDLTQTTSDGFYSVYDLLVITFNALIAPACTLNGITCVIYVDGLSHGSVVAGVQVVVPSGSESGAASAVATVASSNTASYNGSNVSILSLTSGGTTVTSSTSVCDIYNTITSCGSGYECKEVNGVATCSAVAEDNNNLALIVGVVIASVLIVVIIVVIIVCVCKKHPRFNKNKRKSSAVKRVGLITQKSFGSDLFHRPDSGFSDRSKSSISGLFRSNSLVSDAESDVSWAITNKKGKAEYDNQSFLSAGDIAIQGSAPVSTTLDGRYSRGLSNLSKGKFPREGSSASRTPSVNDANGTKAQANVLEKKLDGLTIEDYE